MPFEYHGYRSTFPQDNTMEDQGPASPMDTDSPTMLATPLDICFPENSGFLSPLEYSPCPFLPTPEASTTASHTFADPQPFSPAPTATATATFIQSTSPPSPARLPQPRAFSSHRRSLPRTSPAFREKLRQMALPLAPLVQLPTGTVHPAFPRRLVNFWLLTEAELESLAHFYHQRTPCVWTRHYPCPVAWDSRGGLEEKRRLIGKFMGLRGCETPPPPPPSPSVPPLVSMMSEMAGVEEMTEEHIMEQARKARMKEDEEEAWRRKVNRY